MTPWPGGPLLAIETSCDETSAAVVADGRILSNVVSSQVGLHAEYGGVVPELAAREHLNNLQWVMARALTEASVEAQALRGVAATRGPGLPTALWVGLRAGQALAYARRLPFVGVHHHEAHLYSPWIDPQSSRAGFDAFEPSVSLIVSGGHTLLVHTPAEGEHRVLGSTLDDAAGECFDKTAKLLGLGYPGGPEIDRLSEGGDPVAVRLPRPMLRDSNDDFSFSGLKTAVRYFLRDHPEAAADAQGVRDLCASIQAAIVEVLVAKTVRAAARLGVSSVTAAGGVICNRALRAALAAACAQAGLCLRLAGSRYCTDNAAMIGVLAERKLQRGVRPTDLDADILPGWELDETADSEERRPA